MLVINNSLMLIQCENDVKITSILLIISTIGYVLRYSYNQNPIKSCFAKLQILPTLSGESRPMIYS